MVLKNDQGPHREAFEPFASMEKTQLDQERDLQNLRSQALEQIGGGSGRPASGQEIIHQDYAAAGFDRVGVDGDGVGTVFQIVALLVSAERQLSFLAHRNESALELVSRRRREDKAARVDAHHRVDGAWLEMAYQQVDGAGKQTGIAQDRRDVLK